MPEPLPGDREAVEGEHELVDRRIRRPNDPLNLLAVDGPTNESKGDGDAASWLPPNTAYRCSYVARQIAVKARYRLWVTPAERDAMQRVLVLCPKQRVPVEQGAASIVNRPKPLAATPTKAPSSVYFANCTEAKVAGAAPLYRGQPGCRSELDGDGDGVACET